MPRARTGQLVYRRTSGFNARIWVDVKDETTGEIREERRWVPLGTHDRDLAKRKLAKISALNATGAIVGDATAKAKEVETVRETKEAFITRRKAAGVVMAPDEERWLNNYALARIGDLTIAQVRTRDIKQILDEAALTLSKESVRKLRGTLHRMFNWAWQSEIIAENPVARAPVPEHAKVDERPRTMLTDAQVLVFLNGRPGGTEGKKPRKDAEDRLLELKMMAVCSRVLGGLRTAEVNRWTWDFLLDAEAEAQTFERVRVRRAKAKRGRAGKLQAFIVPDPMRPILRAWHELQGRPAAGPVFPVTKGDRKGQHRQERGTSYAHRLRRELWRMGIRDHAIHNDTPTSKRVDWHSFRRAFASALAAADVGEQRAMRLTAHTDSRVHARYVLESEAMQTIPIAAVPLLPATLGKGTGVPIRAARESGRSETRGDSARPRGFEPLTYGSGGRSGESTCESLHGLACSAGSVDGCQVSRCCAVSSGEKAPGCAFSPGAGASASMPAILHPGEAWWH